MSFREVEHKNYFYFVLDRNFAHHPGLSDRLKAIVSCYYIAKINGYVFRLIDQTDCGIADYIVSDANNLIASDDELEYSFRHTRFLYFSATLCGLDYELPKNKQIHCYAYQGDDIFYHNGADYKTSFMKLFNEMFSPTPILQELLDKTGLTPGGYVAVHARFVNSLGAFESTRYPVLLPEKQEDLIKRCLDAINTLCKSQQREVVVFSDSVRFLDRAKKLPVTILDGLKISHMSHNKDRSGIAKTYLDFWLIKQAAETYRLCSNERELHLTNFSVYAAFAGGVDFVDIKV